MKQTDYLAISADGIWQQVRSEIQKIVTDEPYLSARLKSDLLNKASLEQALAAVLCRVLQHDLSQRREQEKLFLDLLKSSESIINFFIADLKAVMTRDPACCSWYQPLLYFKGFQALQLYRFSHHLWKANRKDLALELQSQSSRVFAVDIHPAAQLGQGILIDHATSVVIGETAIVEDNVSILHEVTLGGTGKEQGDRHPKVRSGVLIGAGAKILGNIEIGECSIVAASSVVLENVPAHTTVAGVPARVIGPAVQAQPALEMEHGIGRKI